MLVPRLTMDLTVLLGCIAFVAILYAVSQARQHAREAERYRFQAMTPEERRAEGSRRHRKRILAEAGPGERRAIIERFAFLDSIEHLSSDEQAAAYARWSETLPKKPASPRAGPRPANPISGVAAALVRPTVFHRSTLVGTLRGELPEVLRSAEAVHMVPEDLVQAGIGAGMEVFSRYARVTDRDSSMMSEAAARELVVAVLYETIVGPTGEFDPEASRVAASIVDGDPDAPAPQTDVVAALASMLPDAVRLSRLASWRSRPWDELWVGQPELLGAADAVTEVGYGLQAKTASYELFFRREGPARYEGFGLRLGGTAGTHPLGPVEADLPPGAFDDLARAVTFLVNSAHTRNAAPLQEDTGGLVSNHVVSSVAWVIRGRARVEIEGESLGQIESLLMEVASGLAWRSSDGPQTMPAEKSGGW